MGNYALSNKADNDIIAVAYGCREIDPDQSLTVMPGLDPGIHGVLQTLARRIACKCVKRSPDVIDPSPWIPGSSPGMTVFVLVLQ